MGPTGTRTITLSAVRLSKASKSASRASLKKAAATRGSNVGASHRLYNEQELQDAPSPTDHKQPRNLEKEMLESSNRRPEALFEEPVPEQKRGSGAGASKGLYADEHVEGRRDDQAADPTLPTPSSSAPGTLSDADLSPPSDSSAGQDAKGGNSRDHAKAAEHVVYTSPPPFNIPLMIVATFSISVFSLTAGDTARVALTTYDEEKQEYVLAPAWKRWSIFGGATLVSVLCTTWGVIMASRVVTKLTVAQARPANALFARENKVNVYTPMTRFSLFKPRAVSLDAIRLLGPLTGGARKPWHPRTVSAPSIWNNIMWNRSTWRAKPGAFARFVVDGDRLSYSMNTKGKAWCVDWEKLERALLEKAR